MILVLSEVTIDVTLLLAEDRQVEGQGASLRGVGAWVEGDSLLNVNCGPEDP